MKKKRRMTLPHLLLWCMGLSILAIQSYGITALRTDPVAALTAAQLCFVATLICTVILLAALLATQEMTMETRKQAYVDFTGLQNKCSCLDKLRELDERDTTLGVGIAMVDLNNLKKINDFYGHDKGDELIQDFAQLLLRLVPDHGFLARFGGDEFVLIEEHTSSRQMEDILHALAQLTDDYNCRHSLQLHFASGFAVSTQQQYFFVDDLLREADKRMYENKKKMKCRAAQEQVEAVRPDAPIGGLLPMPAFCARMEDAMRRMPDGGTYALLCSDIAHFHDINHQLGSASGNLALQMFSQALLQEPDILCAAHSFSDEFIYLLNMAGREQEDVLRRVRHLHRRMIRAIHADGDGPYLAVHTGLYFIRSPQENSSDLLHYAHVARKAAKQAYQPLCVYTETLDQQERARAAILRDFHNALRRHHIRLYLQPQVDACTEEIRGAEALARWVENGKIRWMPCEFIPVLEQTEEIVLLDYYMYRQVFTWLAARREQGLPLIPISMNVSRAHLFRTAQLISYLRRLQRRYAIPPQYLLFEVTETTCIQNLPAMRYLTDALHKMGMQVSMDDFGSGYSSLKMLKHLPFDEIKLDKGFLQDDPEQSSRIILQEMVRLIRRLHKRIVCEGVETGTAAQFLRQEGCDLLQGFYYAQPIPADAFAQLLTNHVPKDSFPLSPAERPPA